MQQSLFLVRWLASVSLALLSGTCLAQQFPTKPITVVIPGAAGGSPDIQARLYGAELTKTLGQPVITDIKPGAGGGIGTTYAARAVPDGHTLLSVATTFTVLPAFFPLDKVPYDPVKDFVPISMMVRNSSMLLVRPDAPFKTFPEYLAYARANPGKINFGTSGAGGLYHLMGAWMHSLTRTEVTFINYKGASPMFVDLLAGRVHVSPASLFNAMPFVKTGKVRAIVVLSKDRTALLPGMKTVSEQGIPDYDYTAWGGILAPAGVPAAILNRLAAETARYVKDPALVSKAAEDGTVMVGSTPAEFQQVLVTEINRWRKLVKDYDIKTDVD